MPPVLPLAAWSTRQRSCLRKHSPRQRSIKPLEPGDELHCLRPVSNATPQVGQTVKRLDTGKRVRVIEVLPVSNTVIYPIEYDSGDHGLVQGMQLQLLR